MTALLDHIQSGRAHVGSFWKVTGWLPENHRHTYDGEPMQPLLEPGTIVVVLDTDPVRFGVAKTWETYRGRSKAACLQVRAFRGDERGAALRRLYRRLFPEGHQ